MKLFGVIGWKDSGKTTLVENLVRKISERGFSVSTVKHAHHTFDIDKQGKDSYRHRQAGATEVLLSSAVRWALMSEARGRSQPSLSSLIEKLSKVDLVLIEGFKEEKHKKIEVHRLEKRGSLICSDDKTVVAIASDTRELNVNVPIFDMNDIETITNFILYEVGLS